MKVIKILVVLLLLVIFVGTALADLYIVYNDEGKCVCIMNIDTEISKYKKLGYNLILVPYSTLSLSKKTKGIKGTEIKQDPEADIQFLDWTNYLSDTGQYYYVEGILKNVSKDIVDFVEVTAICFDREGKLVTTERSYSNPYTLSPDQEAVFKIMIRYNDRIENFDIMVNWKANR